MSRLGDLYKAMETLRKEGLSLNDDLERQVSELEEDIIKKEILPVVTETIEPALKQVQRDLVLVVDYHPGSQKSCLKDCAQNRLMYLSERWYHLAGT